MEKKYKEIISFLKEYQERTHVKGYVLGISGGKDSTVVAKLLVDAIGADNVLGVMLPNSYQPDLNDSLRVCKLLGINYMTVNIENPYLEIQKDIQDANISTTTGTAVLKKRAEIINADAKEAARDKVDAIKKEIRGYKSKIMDLEDLSIRSTESLVVGEGFESAKWVEQMFDVKDRLRDAEIRLGIAQAIYDEYFSEDTTSDDSAE